jgi:hypothetical protein
MMCIIPQHRDNNLAHEIGLVGVLPDIEDEPDQRWSLTHVPEENWLETIAEEPVRRQRQTRQQAQVKREALGPSLSENGVEKPEGSNGRLKKGNDVVDLQPQRWLDTEPFHGQIAHTLRMQNRDWGTLNLSHLILYSRRVEKWPLLQTAQQDLRSREDIEIASSSRTSGTEKFRCGYAGEISNELDRNRAPAEREFRQLHLNVPHQVDTARSNQ